MVEERQKNVLVRIVVILGFDLLLVLGLCQLLEYQSTGVGLAVEERPGLIGSLVADLSSEPILTRFNRGLLRQASNLVINPSFEPPTSTTSTCRGEPVPDGWRCSEWPGGTTDATMLWDDFISYSGTHSVFIIGTKDVNAAWRTPSSHYFQIQEGKQYSFTGWIRAYYMLDGARAYLKLRFLDSDGEPIDDDRSNSVLESTLSAPNGGWVQVKGSGVAPNGARWGRLDAKLEGRGYVHFDDVIVSDCPITPYLVLDVDANPASVSPTGTLTYVVTLVNTGGSPANSVCLTSTLDSRTTLVYSDTDQTSTYAANDQVHVWRFPDGLAPQGDSLIVTLVVSVHVESDADTPLSSLFEASVDDAKPISHPPITTPVHRNVDCDLSSCGTGWAVPGVALDYILTLTNTSNCPISFTVSELLAPDRCGHTVAHPKNTGTISRGEMISLTLTFTPTVNLPGTCYPTLIVIAPNDIPKYSGCRAHVILKPLGLDVVGSPDPVGAGEELTYTLIYTYVGGISAEGLRITVTLDGQAEISTSMPLPDTKISSQTYVWSPIPEPIGGTGEITVVASIAAGSTGFVTCTAQIATGHAEPFTRVITTEIIPTQTEIYLPVILRCQPARIIGPLESGEVVTYVDEYHWYYVDLTGPGPLTVTVSDLNVDGNLLFYSYVTCDCAGNISWDNRDLLRNFGGNQGGEICPMVLSYDALEAMGIYVFVYVPNADSVPPYTISASY